MKSRPLDRDRLFMLKRDHVLPKAAMSLHYIQQLEPEEMVAAVSMLNALVCSRVNVDAGEMHHMSLRMLRDQQHHDKENKLLQSLRDFAGLRIAGQEVVAS